MNLKFTNRPILSIVISVFILLLGVIAMTQLPITQFPNIAPPEVTVTTKYTGANAEVCAKAVVTPLERAINGVAGMTYMTSVSGNDGTSIIQVYFEVGTDPDVAAVNVQTRVQTVLDELPEEVIKAGVITEKEVNSMLLYVNLLSEDTDIDEKFIYNFADINILPELKRIEGWFGTTSAQCGQNVALRIVGGSKEIETKISIYRMGYYGGARARLISVEKTTGNLWKFKVTQSTPPGQYLFRLDADRRKTSFVPLVIRDAKSKSAITFVSSVLTWQVYNKWGGSALTFDRPYDGDGAGQFRYMEFPALYLAERAGHEINYITDLDLDSDPTALRGTKSIVVGGRSEYWTERMRGAMNTSVDRGINLVSLGANTGYNRVTYDPKTRTLSDVIKWRDPTVRKAESQLLGSQFFAPWGGPVP